MGGSALQTCRILCGDSSPHDLRMLNGSLLSDLLGCVRVCALCKLSSAENGRVRRRATRRSVQVVCYTWTLAARDGAEIQVVLLSQAVCCGAVSWGGGAERVSSFSHLYEGSFWASWACMATFRGSSSDRDFVDRGLRANDSQGIPAAILVASSLTLRSCLLLCLQAHGCILGRKKEEGPKAWPPGLIAS